MSSLSNLSLYLKASPLPPAPCQQATADWLPAEMGNFFNPKLSFWRPGGSSRDPQGHPMDTLRPRSAFLHFRVHFGSFLGSTLETCMWFVCDVRHFGPTFWAMQTRALLVGLFKFRDVVESPSNSMQLAWDIYKSQVSYPICPIATAAKHINSYTARTHTSGTTKSAHPRSSYLMGWGCEHSLFIRWTLCYHNTNRCKWKQTKSTQHNPDASH